MKGCVDEDVRSKLVVDFSPDVKIMIREQANKYFEATIQKEQ